jgi:hypothetical protein
MAIPLGTCVQGFVDTISRPSGRSPHAEIRLHFVQMVLADGYSVELYNSPLQSVASDIGSVSSDPAQQELLIEQGGLGGAPVADVFVNVSASSDVLLDNGTQFEIQLERPLSLDSARISAAIAVSKSPRISQFKSATKCRFYRWNTRHSRNSRHRHSWQPWHARHCHSRHEWRTGHRHSRYLPHARHCHPRHSGYTGHRLPRPAGRGLRAAGSIRIFQIVSRSWCADARRPATDQRKLQSHLDGRGRQRRCPPHPQKDARHRRQSSRRKTSDKSVQEYCYPARQCRRPAIPRVRAIQRTNRRALLRTSLRRKFLSHRQQTTRRLIPQLRGVSFSSTDFSPCAFNAARSTARSRDQSAQPNRSATNTATPHAPQPHPRAPAAA